MNGLGGLTADPGRVSIVGSLLPLLIGMGVVVVALAGLLWLLRRRFGPIGLAKIDCAVMGALAVGPRERLVVVRVEGRRLLLGVTGSAIGLLCELPETAASLQMSAPAGFGVALAQAFDRWRGSRSPNDAKAP
ncbi:MAG: flagellar biosynthetic protein FliO [Alphaproteobacteria bacterium]|nr:flagellar biosynthetic protein FliO [Alphaproteobacteria bacterium]